MEEILITITGISATGHRVIADIYIFITFFFSTTQYMFLCPQQVTQW